MMTGPNTPNTPLERVLERLDQPRKQAGSWIARCPAHNDHTPSLSVRESPTGNALVYCHAGCSTPDVVTALGLTFTDLFPPKPVAHIEGGRRIDKIYPYYNADGTLIYEIVKYRPKDFRPRRPDGNGGTVNNLDNTPRVLYNLPQLRKAITDKTTIWLCEGEKDAENAQWWTASQGKHIVATTKAFGAVKSPTAWDDAYTHQLAGATRVVIVADDDPAGHTHAAIVANILTPHVGTILTVLPAEGCNDLSEHISAGHTLNDLRRYKPDTTTDSTDIPEPEPDDATNSDLEAMLINWPQFWEHDRSDQQWVAEPIFAAGRGHAIYAPAKAGKSSVILAVAAAVATGQPILGTPNNVRRSVLYCDYEMTEADLQERLDELGYGPDTDLSMLHYALLPAIAPLDTNEGASTLLKLAELVQAELVIVDTFGRAVQGDENDNDVVRAFYRLVGRPLKNAGRAWVRTDHAGKDVERGQRGASAKNDDVDIVWKLARTDNGARLTRTHSRMNWVDEKLELARTTTNDHLVWTRTNKKAYAPGTKDLAQQLDDLDVPHGLGKDKIRKAYGEQLGKISSDRLQDAIRWRKEQRTTLADQFRDKVADQVADQQRTSDKTPGQDVRTSHADQADQHNSPTADQCPSLQGDGLDRWTVEDLI